MNKRNRAKLKREALRLLERARKTAKLKRIPRASKDDVDDVRMPDGSRYEEIVDDLEEMNEYLGEAGLAHADIGTDERELTKLKAASDRLNAPYRAERERQMRQARDRDYGEDD